MTIEQFRPERSTRGNVLYSKIKPYLENDMRILDIGCAYSCLAGLIRDDFPKCQLFGFDSNGEIIKELGQRYPHYRWERVLVNRGDELKDYISTCPDFIIHIGIDSDEWSAIWKVHEFILCMKNTPRYALLESGRRDGYENPMRTCFKICKFYIEADYELLDLGQFDFDVKTQLIYNIRK